MCRTFCAVSFRTCNVLMYWSNYSFSIPRAKPGHFSKFVWKWLFKFPTPRAKKLFKWPIIITGPYTLTLGKFRRGHKLMKLSKPSLRHSKACVTLCFKPIRHEAAIVPLKIIQTRYHVGLCHDLWRLFKAPRHINSNGGRVQFLHLFILWTVLKISVWSSWGLKIARRRRGKKRQRVRGEMGRPPPLLVLSSRSQIFLPFSLLIRLVPGYTPALMQRNQISRSLSLSNARSMPDGEVEASICPDEP